MKDTEKFTANIDFEIFEENLKDIEKSLLSRAIGKTIQSFVHKRTIKFTERDNELDREKTREVLVDNAAKLVKFERATNNPSLGTDNNQDKTLYHWVNNLINGSGDNRFGIAIYYWFHVKEPNPIYSKKIDDTIFGTGISYEMNYECLVGGKVYPLKEQKKYQHFFNSKSKNYSYREEKNQDQKKEPDSKPTSFNKATLLTHEEKEKITSQVKDICESGLINIDYTLPKLGHQPTPLLGNMDIDQEYVDLICEGLNYDFKIGLNKVVLEFKSNEIVLERPTNIQTTHDQQNTYYFSKNKTGTHWKVAFESFAPDNFLKDNLLRFSNGIVLYAKLNDSGNKPTITAAHILHRDHIEIKAITKSYDDPVDFEKEKYIYKMIEWALLEFIDTTSVEFSLGFEDEYIKKTIVNSENKIEKIKEWVERLSSLSSSTSSNFIHLFKLSGLPNDIFKGETLQNLDLSNSDLSILDLRNTQLIDCNLTNSNWLNSGVSVKDILTTRLDHSYFPDNNYHFNKDLKTVAVRIDSISVTKFFEDCQKGKIEAVKKILATGFDVDSVLDGSTALKKCSQRIGQLSIIKLLLDAKADPNIPDKNGQTALSFASKFGHLEIVQILLKFGAFVDQDVTGFCYSSLQEAAKSNHEEVVKTLIGYGAEIDKTNKNISGGTPLMDACSLGYKRIAKILLDEGADINICILDPYPPNERTPLMAACGSNPDLEIVKIIVKAGANINFKTPTLGLNALSLAKSDASDEIVQYLLANGAKP
ncbi:MAG: ankyrin repeat domain-containing protein [Emcibacteraceae bacterium]|nr:ankyrin repeat domain-containing protein [Emcibacteraceae bacterium]